MPASSGESPIRALMISTALLAQRVKSKLRVVGIAAPLVVVFGPVVHEQ